MNQNQKKEAKETLTRASQLFEQLQHINPSLLIRPLLPPEISEKIYKMEFDYHSRHLYLKCFIGHSKFQKDGDEIACGCPPRSGRFIKSILDTHQKNSKMVLDYFKECMDCNSFGMKYVYTGIDNYHIYVMLRVDRLAFYMDNLEGE